MTPSRRTDNIADIADSLVALHSSDPATVYLSALTRMTVPSIDAVEQALYDKRSLVRHHAMRRTMWVMTPAVARLAHGAATAKIAATERRRTLGFFAESPKIDNAEAWLDAATDAVRALLTHTPDLLTREIGQALPHLAIPIMFGKPGPNTPTLNAHTKVLQGAAFNGDLLRTKPNGTWLSSEYRWSATETWHGARLDGVDELEAAGQLLDRWLSTFGPATDVDIQWWFGWTAGLMKKALEACEAQSVALDDDSRAWVSANARPIGEPEPWVRLLPGLDSTAMGWKQRSWYLDPRMTPRLFDRFGNVGPTVWADGRIVGGWVQRSDATIALDLLADLTKDQHDLLLEAVDAIETAAGAAVVRPRFPSPNQKELLH